MRARAIIEVWVDVEDEPEWDVQDVLERAIGIIEVIDVKIVEEVEG